MDRNAPSMAARGATLQSSLRLFGQFSEGNFSELRAWTLLGSRDVSTLNLFVSDVCKGAGTFPGNAHTLGSFPRPLAILRLE
jgi:hypothetical protein